MKRMLMGSLCLLGAVALAACTVKDAEDTHETTAEEQTPLEAAIKACGDRCELQEANGCNAVSTDDCKSLCDYFARVVSDVCQPKLRLKSECELEQPDICNSEALREACSAEDDAWSVCVEEAASG